jgi:hypothetical protein
VFDQFGSDNSVELLGRTITQKINGVLANNLDISAGSAAQLNVSAEGIDACHTNVF